MRKLLVLDVVAVLVFVLLGRETHDEGNAIVDVLTTAAPFLTALAVGWIVTRIWEAPLDLRRGGALVVVTVAGGMLGRRLVFGDGTALAFIIVAAVFTTAALIGWRVAAQAARNRRSAPA